MQERTRSTRILGPPAVDKMLKHQDSYDAHHEAVRDQGPEGCREPCGDRCGQERHHGPEEEGDADDQPFVERPDSAALLPEHKPCRDLGGHDVGEDDADDRSGDAAQVTDGEGGCGHERERHAGRDQGEPGRAPGGGDDARGEREVHRADHSGEAREGVAEAGDGHPAVYALAHLISREKAAHRLDGPEVVDGERKEADQERRKDPDVGHGERRKQVSGEREQRGTFWWQGDRTEEDDVGQGAEDDRPERQG